MADKSKRNRAARAGWIAFASISTAVAAGIAAERIFVRRDRNRPDAFTDEPYGELSGRPIGPVASFDGTLLHVEEAGNGPVTLVLSHGFSLGTGLWHHQVADLSEDTRLVMFDHRGHARSGRPPSDDWSLEALARDINAIVEDAAPGPVVLLGHSMGGMAVLRFAELFPEKLGDRVIGLVLADTTAADVMGGLLPSAARRVEALFQGLQEAAMRALAGRAETVDRLRMTGRPIAYLGTRIMGFGPKPSPKQVAFVEKLLAETPSDVWLNLIPAMTGFDATEVLPTIDVPVMIVVGTHDRLTPRHAAERMAEMLPQAELAVIEDAGHTPMLERPDVFNEHIRSFITRAQAASKSPTP